MPYRANLQDIERALNVLGGTSTVSAIQDKVLTLFCGGVSPDHYKSERSFRQTIQRIIENHCPQAIGFAGSNRSARFTREARGRYRLIDNTHHAETTKYQPLGKYLRRSILNEEILSLAAIDALVGGLPATANSHQFWANAKDHHPSRRGQWLDAGFEAFYDGVNQRVRFVRTASFDEPTANLTMLDERVRVLLPHYDNSDNTPPKPSGNTRPERLQVYSVAFCRDPRVVAWVLTEAGNKCERCDERAPFVRDDGTPFLEVHHVTPLAEGGPDTTDNAVACCPNCHRFLHKGKGREIETRKLIEKILRLKAYPSSPEEIAWNRLIDEENAKSELSTPI